MSKTVQEEKAVEAALERVSEDADKPAEVDPHEDRTREMRTPGFTRMRTDWHGPDAQLIKSIMSTAENRILVNFSDAYQIINDIYDLVRDVEFDPETGEVLLDKHGFPVWKQSESGRFIEDYSRLGIKEREEFLHQINTRLFDWEQRAADAWGEAMFAKAQWEERFAITFDEDTTGKKTDEARTQRARLGSRDERYFAIFESLYSKKAENLVRSMERIGQRLKDTLYSS